MTIEEIQQVVEASVKSPMKFLFLRTFLYVARMAEQPGIYGEEARRIMRVLESAQELGVGVAETVKMEVVEPQGESTCPCTICDGDADYHV